MHIFVGNLAFTTTEQELRALLRSVWHRGDRPHDDGP